MTQQSEGLRATRKVSSDQRQTALPTRQAPQPRLQGKGEEKPLVYFFYSDFLRVYKPPEKFLIQYIFPELRVNPQDEELYKYHSSNQYSLALLTLHVQHGAGAERER